VVLEVEYDITRDDLYYFQWRASRRSRLVRRERRKVYVYVFLGLLLITLLPALGPDGFDLSNVSFMWLAFVFPVVAFALWLFERRQTRRAISELLKDEKQERGQLGVHKISLNEAGFVESTVVGESRTSWAGVDRIEQDQEYIFIYTAPIAAHIIPKRAFRTLHEAECFYQLATASQQAQKLITVS
jgi:hypothetical protein